MSEKILVINPGSTSTKVGLFDGATELFSENVSHEASRLAEFASLAEQLPYRRDTILEMLDRHGVKIEEVDAFVGRGGGLLPLEGGVYRIDETLLDHARRGANGVTHPANLGSQLAWEFANVAGDGAAKPAFVVNPPDTDELCDEARVTGMIGVYRHVHLHALNLKETAIRHAARLGRAYEDCNFVVAHIGGGISVSAHCRGRMIDGNDIVGGEGPMTPTRCGSVPVVEVLDLIEAGSTTGDIRKLCMKTGGLVDLVGTADSREVERRASEGDKAAQLAWRTLGYQVCKWIGAMACALDGDVDGILLGGGMAHSDTLVGAIERRCGWIAPVTAYPGEFELEAMAAGACRVLSGAEAPKTYQGVPVWEGFDL